MTRCITAMELSVGLGHVISRVQELPTAYKLVYACCLPLRGWLFRFS